MSASNSAPALKSSENSSDSKSNLHPASNNSKTPIPTCSSSKNKPSKWSMLVENKTQHVWMIFRIWLWKGWIRLAISWVKKKGWIYWLIWSILRVIRGRKKKWRRRWRRVRKWRRVRSLRLTRLRRKKKRKLRMKCSPFESTVRLI